MIHNVFVYIKKLSYSRVIEILRIVNRVARVYFWVNISFFEISIHVCCLRTEIAKLIFLFHNSENFCVTLIMNAILYYSFFRVYIFIAQLLHLTRVYMANEFVCYLG